MNIATDPLFTVKEAAQALKVSAPSFLKIRKEHPDLFQEIISGGRICFSASQLNQYLIRLNPHLATSGTDAIATAAAAAVAAQGAGK